MGFRGGKEDGQAEKEAFSRPVLRRQRSDCILAGKWTRAMRIARLGDAKVVIWTFMKGRIGDKKERNRVVVSRSSW